MRKICLQCIYNLAKKDPRIVFIGSDLGVGILDEFKAEMPERFFMEGIAEQHVIGMAAGLAKEGYIPYVNTIATFLTRRCYDQIAIDLCLQNLPVRLIGNGAGLVYAPLGPTHQAIEDISIMRALPNMTVIAPSDAYQMEKLMSKTVELPGPAYIRLGKGYDEIVTDHIDDFEIGKAELMSSVGEVLIVATGIMLQRAIALKDQLLSQGVKAGVLNMHTIKPLDESSMAKYAKQAKLLITMEENTRIGGLGSAVIESLVDAHVRPMPQVLRFGLPDSFSEKYGSQDEQLDYLGFKPSVLASNVLSTLQAM